MNNQTSPPIEQEQIPNQNPVPYINQSIPNAEEASNLPVESQPSPNLGSQPIIDEASLEDRVQSGQEMPYEQQMPGDLHNKIRRLIQKTEMLHADEEFLKEELKVRERDTLATYDILMQKKKELLLLVMETYNRNSAFVDIGLSQELGELKKIVEGQESKLQQLKLQIGKQGLAGVLTDDKEVRIKTKTEEVQKQYKVGRKFSSTQYVRDYLERPQAYKVSYQESKYEYEVRVRIKQCLQQEKKLYEKKKQEINQAKRRQRQRQQQLHKQKDQWCR